MANSTRGNPVWVKLDKSAIPATKTSVKLGQRASASYRTTNASDFSAWNAYGGAVQASNKDFIRDIKADHFSTEDGRSRSAAAKHYHYTSNSRMSFNFKGDASAIAAKLDPSQKDDLRRNHFEVGGHSANVAVTTVARNYRPHSLQQRNESKPQLNRDQLNELRKSHWSTEPSKHLETMINKRPGSAKHFMTTHMQTY